MVSTTRTLYRPVGKPEMDLVRESRFTAFPPRLPMQPIFYPVLEREYAVQIARDWNTKDAASGHEGYVLEFDVDADFLDRYQVQTVGAAMHRELWVPADELEAFNAKIIGPIRVVERFGPRTDDSA